MCILLHRFNLSSLANRPQHFWWFLAKLLQHVVISFQCRYFSNIFWWNLLRISRNFENFRSKLWFSESFLSISEIIDIWIFRHIDISEKYFGNSYISTSPGFLIVSPEGGQRSTASARARGDDDEASFGCREARPNAWPQLWLADAPGICVVRQCASVSCIYY